MKFVSALQNWYSTYHDKKLRKFENKCLDDIVPNLPEQDRDILIRQFENVKVAGLLLPFSKELVLFNHKLNDRLRNKDGSVFNGILAKLEYGFIGMQSVLVEVGVSDGLLAGFVMSRRMTWYERNEANCELISISMYPSVPPLPSDFDILIAHRAELWTASESAVTVNDSAPRGDFRLGFDRWSWFLGEINNQYYLLQDNTSKGMVRLLDYSAHEYSAECPCVIPLLKWAAAHLNYLEQSDVDQIVRAVALLPDPPGVKVTPLVDCDENA